MSNPTTGFGLSILNRQDGVSPTFATRVYPILYTYATAIGRGDAVKLNTANSGNIERYAAGDHPILGVADQFYWSDTSFQQPIWSSYWPASPAAVSGSSVAYVYDDPNASYYVRVSSTAITKTSLGRNAELVTTNTPNTANGQSTETLLSSSPATTATFPVKIIEIAPTGPTPCGQNDASSANNIVRVKLNNALISDTTGI